MHALALAAGVLGWILAGLAGPSGSPAPPVDGAERFVLRDEAVRLALARHPAIAAGSDREAAAALDRRQAGAWSNPRLETEAEGFGGDRRGFDEAEVTVGMGAGLDLFGRSGLRADAADAAVAVETAHGAAARRNLGAEVRRAYHEVLAARERLGLARGSVRVTAETRDAIRRQVDAGEAPEMRAIQAEAVAEAAAIAEEDALARHARAEARFARLLGGPERPTGTLRGASPDSVSGLASAAAIAGHPEVSVWRATGTLLEAESRRLARERWPDIDVSVGYRHSRGEGWSDWVGGVTVELPLFDRGGAGAAAARRRAAAAAYEGDATSLALEMAFDESWSALAAAARSLARHDRDLVPRAREIARMARLGYTEGKFGFLDLMTAEQALLDAETSRAEALIEHDRALTELEILLDRTLGEDAGAATEE